MVGGVFVEGGFVGDVFVEGGFVGDGLIGDAVVGDVFGLSWATARFSLAL